MDAPVTHGPFAYLSDPQYVGTTMALLGAAVQYRSVVGMALTVLMGAVFHLSTTYIEVRVGLFNACGSSGSTFGAVTLRTSLGPTYDALVRRKGQEVLTQDWHGNKYSKGCTGVTPQSHSSSDIHSHHFILLLFEQQQHRSRHSVASSEQTRRQCRKIMLSVQA